MEGIEDETSHWSDAFDTKKGIVFTDLSLTIRIEHDLPALNSRLAQASTVMHQESKGWTLETVEDIRLRSSMKAPRLPLYKSKS